MISFVLPTHNRLECLHTTLDAIGLLGKSNHDGTLGIGLPEVIVVDNASSPPVKLPRELANGWPVRVIRLNANQGAAARNVGVEHATGEWVIMLDDDSYPLDNGYCEALQTAPLDVAAIGADIYLPSGARESGGLPEVFIGCGVAIRRNAFLQVGGYDSCFDYYAEEYDLCAKLLLNGGRVMHDQRFRVRHEKLNRDRDMNRILHRLVRNNGWVMQRYAPDVERDWHIRQTVARYAEIAVKENAASGFSSGMAELIRTIDDQPRRSMSAALFDRFTGLSAVRETVATHSAQLTSGPVAILDEGKNSWAVHQALAEIGAEMTNEERNATTLMTGTLSPGPMLDSYKRRAAQFGSRPVLPGWMPACAKFGSPHSDAIMAMTR